MKQSPKSKTTEERILDKLDSIDGRLGSIDVTLAKQNVTLEEHIRRTELLELDVQPIKKHVAMFEGALKLIGAVGLIAGVIASVIALKNLIR